MTQRKEPSIHIGKSKLTQVLQEFISNGIINSNITLDELACKMIAQCNKYSLTHRSIMVSNEKLEKRIEKLNASLKEDSVLFSNTYYFSRKKRKHIGIMLITSSHKDWPMVKMVTELANDFSNGFGFTNKKQGYIEYISTALDIMGSKININRFPSLHERICDEFSSKKEIESDSNKQVTETLCKLYNKKILDMTGITDDIASKPDSLSYFVKASNYCKEYGISPTVYIDSQFDGLSFTNTIPYPSQMAGDKAKERLVRYMSKIGIRARSNKSPGKSWLDMKKLNSIK